MKAVAALVVIGLLLPTPARGDILDADGLAACTDVSNAAERLLVSRYVPGFITSLRAAADRGARSSDPYVRSAAQGLRVATLDAAVPAVKIFMQACTDRVAQKPNVQVWGPSAPAPPTAPSAPVPATQGTGLVGALENASRSVEQLTNRMRQLNQEMQKTGQPATAAPMPPAPAVLAPATPPRMTTEEAERQAKRSMERSGLPNAKCTTKNYGGGAAVTVCE